MIFITKNAKIKTELKFDKKTKQEKKEIDKAVYGVIKEYEETLKNNQKLN